MDTLSTSDIFHDSWEAFKPRNRAMIARINQYYKLCLSKDSLEQAGYQLRLLLRKIQKNKSIFKRLTPEVLVDCYNDLAFLHEPFYDFPIYRIKVNGEEYIPPAWVKGQVPFGEVSFYQWKFMDSKFTKYLVYAHGGHTTEAKEELKKFLATIYQSEWAGFHEDQMAPLGERLYRKLALWEIDLIIETFGHIRNYLFSRYPNVFPASPEESPSSQEGARGSSPIYTGELWDSLHYDLADTEAFKGYISAGEAGLHHALGYLDKKIADMHKQQENAA